MPDYQTGEKSKSLLGINLKELLKDRFNTSSLPPRLLTGLKVLVILMLLGTLFYNMFFVYVRPDELR